MSEQADQIELELVSALQRANRTSFTKDFLKQNLNASEGALRDFLTQLIDSAKVAVDTQTSGGISDPTYYYLPLTE